MSLYRLAGLLLGIIWNNPVPFGRSIYVFFFVYNGQDARALYGHYRMCVAYVYVTLSHI